MLSEGYHAVPPGHVAAVVTHLDMPRPAQIPPPRALPPGLSLRHVTEPTADWYRDLYRRIGEGWLWWSRLLLDDATLLAKIAQPEVVLLALEREGRAEGLAELDFATTGSCELAFFGLTPGLIGAGAGRALMSRAIARAFAEPVARLHLHTCTLDSPQALAFYIRTGFTPTRREIEIARDPRLNKVLPPQAAPQIPLIQDI